METNDQKNSSQIIRRDARNCFVESLNDAFDIGKMHLVFATYDTSRPTGKRQTNYVSIYIDAPEFLCLAQETLSGKLHYRATQQKAKKDPRPLFESLGGISAEKLEQYERPRPDGMSLSRTIKLLYSDKRENHYLLIADSGPGATDKKGLIVPKFGSSPENHVAVCLSQQAIDELMMMTKVNYEAWLAAKYMGNAKRAEPHQASIPQSPADKKPTAQFVDSTAKAESTTNTQKNVPSMSMF